MAGRARRVDARQEQQLDHDEALALARLAAALGDVEREAAGVVAARARASGSRRTACGRGRTGRCTWRGSSAACVRSASGRRAPAGRAAPCPRRCGRRWTRPARPRVDHSSRPSAGAAVPERARDELDQRLADKARLPRARNAGDAVSTPSGKRDVEAVQVVARDACSSSQPRGVARRPRRGMRCSAKR